MEYIEKNDLIHGQYYHYNYGNRERFYIIKLGDKGDRIALYLIPYSRSVMLRPTAGHCMNYGLDIRHATQQEIKWLEACHTAGKFVPEPVVIDYGVYQ